MGAAPNLANPGRRRRQDRARLNRGRPVPTGRGSRERPDSNNAAAIAGRGVQHPRPDPPPPGGKEIYRVLPPRPTEDLQAVLPGARENSRVGGGEGVVEAVVRGRADRPIRTAHRIPVARVEILKGR